MCKYLDLVDNIEKKIEGKNILLVTRDIFLVTRSYIIS